MRKTSNIWLALVLSTLLAFVAACGTHSSSTPSSSGSTTVPAGENLYVLDGYAPQGAAKTGNQQIIAFHPAGANPDKLVSLPMGLTSSDHQRLYRATAKNGQTTVAILNTRTGATIRTLTIPGTYSTGQYFDNAMLSYNGQWLALRQMNQAENQTTIALIDTQAGRVTKTIHLSGYFDLDAVSPDGSRIYLLERLNDGTGHYYVRLYQVDQNQLMQGAIIDKTIPNDIMIGTALTRQMASDGQTAYTLYVDTVHNIAFVHILPLAGDFLGARCIDLPIGKSSDLLRYYTLSLSPNGSPLYAANGALGVASAINLTGNDEVFNDKVESTVRFNPGSLNMTSSDKAGLLQNGAVLSHDGNTLYVAGVRGIWAFNTTAISTGNSSVVQGNYLTQQAFTSVAISSDGRTLYAVDPTSGITLLDSATGQVRQVIQGPAQAPWGIEWIAN